MTRPKIAADRFHPLVSTPSKKRFNKRIVSDPLQYSKGSILRSNFLSNCFVHVSDENKKLWGSSAEPLVPHLGWLHEVGTPPDPSDGFPRDGYGWSLHLSALKVEDKRIGYANWDDPEGIRTLVELLEDKEALFAFASLQFPDAMAEATEDLANYMAGHNK